MEYDENRHFLRVSGRREDDVDQEADRGSVQGREAGADRERVRRDRHRRRVHAGRGHPGERDDTVLGLIGMLNNLEDKSSLGPNMAVALITTLYGSMMANWLITPFSTKLANQNAMEMRSKEMIIEGVLAIQAGENPRIMAQKLLTYLDPVTRKAIEADVLKD